MAHLVALRLWPRPGARRSRSEAGQVGVEMGDGFDATEIVFEGQMFVGSVGVFVWEAEADEHAGNFEGVVHLRYEGDGTALANEDRFFPEAFFEGALRDLENWRVKRGNPRFAGAQDVEFAFYGFGYKFADVFFDKL